MNDITNEEQRRENLEIDLLLEGLFQLYETDFRGYERRSLRNRMFGYMASLGLKTVSSLLALILHDKAAADALCRALVVHDCSPLFDDAVEFRVLRSLIDSSLSSFAAPKVWLAECLCVEEIFAFAILLMEAGLYDRTLIFATCSNDLLLQEIRRGAFPLERLASYEESYRRAGGMRSLGDYICERDGQAVFSEALRSRIIWAQYHLGTDSSFNEFQLISCRKSFSDFNPMLRKRILNLFNDSLSHFGILNVPVANDTETYPLLAKYRASDCHGIYRRMI
ncbi:CheR family methyltransferase [Noviherbaspirillum malthae]|uniref:CheR family methyltransferase n=1 Tax=Noviherbaspirillum malthae TaxID=1260987 RepID=UPI00189096EB|nr:CheR family methyltransferase [Noviherbaspirillum malthae]